MPPAAATPRAGLLQGDGITCSVGLRVLFDRLSLRVPVGVTLVQGGEGTGKTSLLRLLAGELAASSGQLQIGTVDLATHPEVYRQQVFLADPRTQVFDQTTPLAYLASLQARYPGFDAACIGELIDGLSLAEHQHKPLYMLSTGSRRKVWFAGAVASGATVTLLDEPFAALDSRSMAFVRQLLTDAANNPLRAWVLADYEAPAGVPLAGVIDLG